MCVFKTPMLGLINCRVMECTCNQVSKLAESHSIR